MIKYLTRVIFPVVTAVALFSPNQKALANNIGEDLSLGHMPAEKPYKAETLQRCYRQFHIQREQKTGELRFYEVGREESPAYMQFDANANIKKILSKAEYKIAPWFVQGERVSDLKLRDRKTDSWGQKNIEESIKTLTEKDIAHDLIETVLIGGEEYGVFCSKTPINSPDVYGKHVPNAREVYMFKMSALTGYEISDKGEFILNTKGVSRLVPKGESGLGNLGLGVEPVLYQKNTSNSSKRKPKTRQGARVPIKAKTKQKSNAPKTSFVPNIDSCNGGAIIYHVKKGETLEKIAKQLKISVEDIKKNLFLGKIRKEDNMVFQGDNLYICYVNCR